LLLKFLLKPVLSCSAFEKLAADFFVANFLAEG
jgi:hypothetical protein